MKLSFSTLGAPDWSMDEILKYAKQYGFDGVGFRGVKGQMDLTKIPEFLPENRKATLKRFRDAGIEIMMMLTGAWRGKGVFNVEEFDPTPFMQKLGPYGLPWTEKFLI